MFLNIYVEIPCAYCRTWLREWCATAAPPTTLCWTNRAVCASTAGSPSSTQLRHTVSDTHAICVQYLHREDSICVFNVAYPLVCRGVASGTVLLGGRHQWWRGCVSDWPRSSSHRSEGCTLARHGQWWYPLFIHIINVTACRYTHSDRWVPCFEWICNLSLCWSWESVSLP